MHEKRIVPTLHFIYILVVAVVDEDCDVFMFFLNVIEAVGICLGGIFRIISQ